MAGHSKWAKIKRGKAAEDAKRGAIFTKLGNKIALAAKKGGDPDLNPSLAFEIEKAKEANMPNANIERSIKRGTGELGGDEINEYTYEGYGPGGIAIIVEAASDNRNRISTDIKTAFSKNGGNMAETGAVAFQFDRKGVIHLKVDGDMDLAILDVLDAGAEDAFESDGELVVYTNMKELHQVKEKLEEKYKVKEANLEYIPENEMKIVDENIAKKAIKLMDALEDIDDVNETFTNFDIEDDLIEE